MTESKSIKIEKLFVGREKEFGTIESLHYVIILTKGRYTLDIFARDIAILR